MNQAIVITSIFSPGEALRCFAALSDWRLVVVADRKTPADWQLAGARLIAVDEQRRLPFRIIGVLPWNHYARKMIGYLWAAREGASLIAESDDDNRPKKGWGFPAFEGEFQHVRAGGRFVNIYTLFSDQAIWPRGLPLAHIRDGTAQRAGDALAFRPARVGVWQALADDDPDVDAIYRLTSNAPCRFEHREPVVLDEGRLSPFNSQNTAFRSELLPLMYLPAYVNFRVTDILRGYVAQPIMWAAGYRLGFTTATVDQTRNAHDLMDDFRSELPLFLHAEEMTFVIEDAVRAGDAIADNLHRVYARLSGRGFVGPGEMELVDAWLEDVTALT
ncbi:MAG: STELLO glycosyltransferase family protein [Desulfobacterales bacterium]|nr:STELLO glycosyltransferase family protein [Desulfobacterales bacterium]